MIWFGGSVGCFLSFSFFCEKQETAVLGGQMKGNGRPTQKRLMKALDDDDALELFKANLPSTSLMQVQRGTALAKRELENLIGQAAQGLYSGETRHESRGNDVDWMKHTAPPGRQARGGMETQTLI